MKAQEVGDLFLNYRVAVNKSLTSSILSSSSGKPERWAVKDSGRSLSG